MPPHREPFKCFYRALNIFLTYSKRDCIFHFASCYSFCIKNKTLAVVAIISSDKTVTVFVKDPAMLK